MYRKRAYLPVLFFLVLGSLACVIFQLPVSKSSETGPSQEPPTSAPPSESAPINTPAGQAVPPTATLFPEQQLHIVTDQTKAIQATIPVIWTDMRTAAWVDENNQTIGTTFMASTNIEDFLNWKAEGVAISVSRHLQVGYVELLDQEYEFYIKQCEDTYRTRWTLENPIYAGKYVVFGNCGSVQNTWLSLFSVTSKKDAGKYIARVLAYDMIPTYGDTFRDIIMQFQVFPENLP